MTTYHPYRKGTILAPSGRADHLHVICNDPIHYPIHGCLCVLVVNISSVKFGVPHDATCILKSGEHGFIKHDSYVVYERSVIWRVDNMLKKHESGEIKIHQDMCDETFRKILSGFDISDEVIPRNLKFWKEYCQ
ncbi:hypothetical protein DVP82_18620 [Yersinia enterocolitica]|nr:hypothetical protein [Yersinia enterocolitica]